MERAMITTAGFSGKQIREMNVKKIALHIMEIMQNHVGNEYSISKENLFKKLFKQKLDDNKAGHWMAWTLTKRAMHKLRRDSDCFIASTRCGATFEYFIVADDTDADFYISHLDSCIRRMRIMQRKVKTAVRERWHEHDWNIEYRVMKRLK